MNTSFPCSIYYAMRDSASAVLDGLAIDAANDKLYYADAGNVGKIGELSLDGKHHRVLVTESESKPRSIVLDLSSRYNETDNRFICIPDFLP